MFFTAVFYNKNSPNFYVETVGEFMEYYLGIDGGGTKTTASVCDGDGKIIYTTVGKTLNFRSVSMAEVRKNLASLMEDICKKIGNTVFESVFIGCSALDDEADAEAVEELCGGIVNGKKIRMNSDVYVALFSGDCTVPRGVVICGTGSMAVGMDCRKKITVKGGWGHIIGDGGSAYSIAVNALSRAAVMFDNNEKDSLLVKAAQAFFKTDSLRKIIDTVYDESTSKDKLADFAKSVSLLCEKGDKTSREILSEECNKILKTAFSLAKETDGCEILYLYGGVFQNNEFFKNLFIERFSEKYPNIKVNMLSVTPAEGALKAAMEAI